MALWTQISADFNSLDESINFGTRAFAETDDCIYETSTLATIHPESEVTEYPPVISLSLSGDKTCVAVGLCLTTFSVNAAVDVIFSQVYDSQICALTATPDSNFLLIGLQKGSVVCVHIPSVKKVFSWSSSELFSKPGNVVSIIYDKKYLYCINSSGCICRISGTDFDDLHEAWCSEGLLPNITSGIVCEEVASGCSIRPLQSVACRSGVDGLSVVAVGGGFAVWSDGWDEFFHAKLDVSLKKVHFCSSEQLVLALTSKGELVQICPYTSCTKLVQVEAPLVDFLVVSTNGIERVLAITQRKADGSSTLLMFCIPGFEVKLRLKIGSPAVLVSMGDAEDILYLEFMDDDEDEGSIAGLALKAAVQTNPNFRLDRLLMRRKFDAALQLAHSFSLDLTPIHKTMAQNIIESLQPWNSSAKSLPAELQSSYVKLVSLLDKINDLEFICHCCVEAISSDLDILRDLLQYAKTRITDFLINNPEEEAKVIGWSRKAGSCLHRLDTFALTEPTWNVEKWVVFSQSHPLTEVRKRLKMGQLEEASTIWNRHLSECRQVLTDERQYLELVEIIPLWVPLDGMILWLKQLLPIVLPDRHSTVLKMVEWITPKIKAVENLPGCVWPESGLEYAKSIVSFLNEEYSRHACVGMQGLTMRPLVLLVDALTDLAYLKNSFGLYISLVEYLEDEPEEVVFTFLRKVNASAVRDFLHKFLISFVNRRKLDLDDVLSQYVKSLVRHSPGWWMWDVAPWEAIVIALIPEIANCEMRFECILAVLEEAPVPWSPIVTKLADDVAGLNHPLASKISEKRKQIAVNMIAKKYKIRTAISKMNKNSLLRLIIEKSLPSMSEDVEQLVNSTELAARVDLIFTCILAFIHKGKLDDASLYLSKLDDAEAVSLCLALVDDLPPTELSTNEDCLFKISLLAVIKQRLKKAQSRGVSSAEIIEHVRYTRNVMVMKVEFPSLAQVSPGRTKESVFLENIDNLLSEEKSNCSITIMKRLADLLQLPEQENFIKLAIHLVTSNKMEAALAVTREAMQIRELKPEICSLVNALAGILLASSGSVEDCELRQRMVLTAYDISQQSCTWAKGNTLYKANELASWARTCVGLNGRDVGVIMSPSDTIQKRLFPTVHSDAGSCGFSNDSKLSQSCSTWIDLREGNADLLNNLPLYIQQLLKNQKDLAALALLGQLQSSLHANKAVTAPVEEIMSEVLVGLLAKVVNNRYVDTELSICLMSYLGKEQVVNFLSDRLERSQMDLKKQSAVAKLGVIVCELWQDFGHDKYFRNALLSNTWGALLPKFNISSKELSDNASPDILKKLLAAPNVTVDTIQNFCQDYKCDFQGALTLHLKMVLVLWEPGLEIRKQADEQRIPVISNSEEELLKRCRKIMEYVEEMGPIQTMLVQIWTTINFYYHEVFLVVLHLLQELKVAESDYSQRHLLLSFLKTYRRRRPPGMEEENSWNESFSTCMSLPPIAEFRLPYSRPVIEGPSSAILMSEITLQTYSTWLTVAPALNFNEDRMRTIAVHQSVTEEFGNQQSAGGTWCRSIKYNALYESVKECVSNVQDLMRASACLYFFTNKTPPGADQLRAAKLCLDYTERLAQTFPENVDKLQKVRSKYLNLATTHLLHFRGLGEPQYLQLVGSPEALITKLYHHPAIVDHCLGTRAHCPNIHEAVNKIGQLHNIVIKSLQVDLVMEWLQIGHQMNGDDSLDESTIRPDTIESDMKDKTSSANLMRARYVMEHGDLTSWMLYLQRLAIGSEATGNDLVRLRALRCMCMLADPETVAKLSGCSKTSIRELERTLEYVGELEELGFACSDVTFQNYNKGELAAVMLKRQPRRPRAVSLVARLCLDYNVEQMSVWRTVLKQLTQLKMLEELGKILPSLTKQYELSDTTEFIEAWNTLVVTPFTEANNPPDRTQITAMLSAVQLLTKCPILYKVKTQDAVDACFKIKMFELATLVLPFCEKSKRSSIRKTILESASVEDLEERLINTCSLSLFNARQVLGQLRDPVSV